MLKPIQNCKVKIALLVKNYQYVDKYTVIGMIHIFSNYEGKIYGIRKKEYKFITTFFFITENDIWKINSDQINNFSEFSETKGIRSRFFLNETAKFTKSGFLLKKDGFKMIFQNAFPIFLSRGTILNYKQGDFVLEKQLLATLVNFTQQTEDIVQGLPKIEELIEARVPKIKSFLSIRPGIFLNPSLKQNFYYSQINQETISSFYSRQNLMETNNSKIKRKKQLLEIIHSIYTKEQVVYFEKKMWKVFHMPSDIRPFNSKTTYQFANNNNDILLISVRGKNISKGWEAISNLDSTIFKYDKKNLVFWKKIKKNGLYYHPKVNALIVQTNEDEYFFLECLNPIYEYQFPLSTNILSKSGFFIDLGEPITEGIIDPHELLFILFQYHSVLDGIMNGVLRSLNKFQLLLVNSVQSIYQSQGVNISSKHIEIIVRQMTSKVVIKESGDTPLLPGELIRLSLITEIYKALYIADKKKLYRTPKYEPLFLSTTNSSLSKDGFLSAAGFQETKRVLTKAAIEGNSDWLRGLKECVIIGRLIPAGSAFLNYKNYLDNIYLFKD